MTTRLVNNYRTAKPSAGRQPIAVLPFNSNAKRTEEGTGTAVADILTHDLVGRTEFLVVERSQIEKVMSEHSFQLSGAVDSATAVRVGNLLGARYVVLGSVEKLAGQYQINARIVEVQNGQVVATAFEEIPATLLEAEAKPYLVEPPARHAIGFYVLYNYRHNSNRVSGYPEQAGNFGPAVQVSPHPYHLGMIGGGVRYFPVSSIMTDLSVAYFSGHNEISSVQSGNPGFYNARSLNNVITVRATANWVRETRFGPRTILGAGLCTYKASPQNMDFKAAIAPSLRAGLEVRPKRRFGIALLFNYDFINAVGKEIYPPFYPGLRIDRWSIEPSIGVYF